MRQTYKRCMRILNIEWYNQASDWEWGLVMSYMYVWEHCKGGRHVNAAWSSITEDLYNT